MGLNNFIKNFSLSKYISLIREWFILQKQFVRQQIDSSIINNPLPYNTKQLYQKVHQETEPVFVLSTGRSGTMFLYKLLTATTKEKIIHHGHPDLSYYSGIAYYQEDNSKLKAIVDASRYEQIRDSFILS